MHTAAPASHSAAKAKSSTRTDDPEPKRILIIGGTQFIGRVLVTDLVKAGHEVHILHRKPRHPFGKRVRNLVADRNDVASVRKAISDTRYDVVFDNAYDWEHGTTGLQVEAIAQIFDGKIGRYVFMSSVAAYGDGLNHHEGDALAPDDHPNPYARHKAMSERALFRLHQRTGFPIVTLRPPFIYGPGNPFYREAFFWDRFKANRPVILPSEGHRLMQFVYINTANPKAITQHELVQHLALAAGCKDPRFISVPRETIYRAGGQVTGEKLYFGSYYDVPAITQIITKAQRMLAFKPTEFDVGLKVTYRAFLKKRAYPKPDFGFEDELLTSKMSAASRSA